MSVTSKAKAGQYYKRLSITDDKIQRKSEELIRILDLRAPQGIPGREANACKYAVCIHLACKLNNAPFNRNDAFKECGCNSATYRDAYNLVLNILQINIPQQIEMIGKEFNCPHLVKFVKKAFASVCYWQSNISVTSRYKEIFTNSLAETKRDDLQFDSPAYVAAAFLLTAEYKKIDIHKAKLIEITDCRNRDFDMSYDSINELIFQPLMEQESQLNQGSDTKDNKKDTKGNEKKSKKGQPKKEHDDNEVKLRLNDILEIKKSEEILENIRLDLHVSNELEKDESKFAKETKEDKASEFEKWVQEVLSEEKAQVPTSSTMKQTNLSGFFLKSKQQQKQPKSISEIESELFGNERNNNSYLEKVISNKNITGEEDEDESDGLSKKRKLVDEDDDEPQMKANKKQKRKKEKSIK